MLGVSFLKGGWTVGIDMLERGARDVLSQEAKWESKLAKAALEAENKILLADKAAQKTHFKIVSLAKKNAKEKLDLAKSESDSRAELILTNGKKHVKKVEMLNNDTRKLAKELCQTLIKEVSFSN